MSVVLRADLLQHLMDEGQASKEMLMRLSGYPRQPVNSALRDLRKQGLVLRTKARDASGYSIPLHSLTPRGIELALEAAQANYLLTKRKST